nr:GNAT family N-acetyltransferase [bacterium]
MPMLRIARPEDAPALLNIYAPYIEHTAITFEETVPTVEAFSRRMQGIQARFPYLVAVEGGQPIGYAYAASHHERAAYRWNAELSIYLDQNVRRQGVGSMLYRALISCLEQMGYINLYALVTQPNEASMSLHRRVGFEVEAVAHKTGYKMGRWRDVATLHLALAGPEAPAGEPVCFCDLPQQSIQRILCPER